MGVYAVTGSASGMGQKVAQRLCDAGHTVIGVDMKQADIVADLSTAEGRRAGHGGGAIRDRGARACDGNPIPLPLSSPVDAAGSRLAGFARAGGRARHRPPGRARRPRGPHGRVRPESL